MFLIRSRRSHLPLVLLSSFLLTSFTALKAAPTTAPAIQAEFDPPLRWVPWTEEEIQAVNTNSKDQTRSTRGLLDGKPNTCTFFDKLQGSVTSIQFKEPRKIERLAFLQGGQANWATPRKLRLILDSDESAPVTVDLQDARGKVQAIPLNRTARRIDVRVESVWETPGKTKSWGGFAGIGEAVIAPAEWSLVEQPLQDHQTKLRVTVTSPVDTQAFVKASMDERVIYDHPPLALRAGTHEYMIDLGQLTESEPYDLPPYPRHLDLLTIAGSDPSVALRIDALVPVEPAREQAHWEPLPPLDFPTREVNGETWREGLSYRTAGRFGNSTYNGLLTELVGPSWFRAYTANATKIDRRQDFDFWADGQATDDTGRGDLAWKVRLRSAHDESEKISINWTTMRVDRDLGNGDIAHYTYSILAPGFLVDVPRPLNLSSRGGGRLPIRSGAPDEDEARFQTLASGEIPKIGPAAVLTSKGLLKDPQQIRNLEEPWIVGIWGIGDEDPTFWGDKAVAILLTSDTKSPIEWTASGLRLPPGRWGVSSAFYGLLNDNWKPEDLIARARLLTRLLRTYPVECREFYKVDADSVRILNEFTYERWGRPEWQHADYAPIPPIYSWARDSVQWSGIPAGQAGEEIKTPVGPYRWEDGSSLTYSLPRFAAPHAAFPARPEFSETIQAMEGDIEAAAIKPPLAYHNNHPWRMAYFKNWSHGLLGGSYLGEKARSTLIDIAKPLVHRMYEPSSWIPRKERFSGEPYYVRGWRDRTALPAMFGDPNSNVGQPAYSLALYAKYTGDWAFVETQWPRIMDTLRIFEVLNDWAVPQTTSREAVKYGSIDMDTIAYAGLTGLERMAEVLDKKEDHDRIAYLRAKMAASTALRFNFPQYLDPDKKYPELFGVGFAEDGPALERAAPGKGVGLDHVAMCLTWTGELPEMYGFYFNVLGPDYMREFQSGFMDKYFSDWRTMPFNTNRSAAHIAARSYLPDWPAEGIREDVAAWLKHIKRDTPPYATSGMVGAWSGHDTGVSLVNWEPARFISSSWQQADRKLEVQLAADKPFALEFSAPGKVRSAHLDGVPLPASDITTSAALSQANPTALHHRLQLPHGGRIEIVMDADEKHASLP